MSGQLAGQRMHLGIRHRWAVVWLCAVVVMATAPLLFPKQAAASTGTRLSISASAKNATAVSKVTLTGTLKTTSGQAVGSRAVRLERMSNDTWVLLKRYTTNSRGKVYARVQPADDRKYRFRYSGGSKYRRSSSSSRLIGGYAAPTLEFSGSGTSVVGPFTLEKGLSVAQCIPGQTDSNFVIWLVDASGDSIDLLANEIGPVPSSKATNIPATGVYYLNVRSDTTWAITIKQPRQLTAPATRSFGATGSYASELFRLSKTGYKFTWQNTGTGNFIVWLRDRNGGSVDLVANEIGSSSGSVLVSVPASSQYVLDVQADGPWSISCTAP